MSEYSDLDYPHPAGDDPDFQESFVLVFRDLDTDLVGFLRVGSYVNQGTAQMHWGMSLPDGTRFRRHLLDLELQPGWIDANSMTAGPMRYSIPEGGHMRFTAEDADAEVDLYLEDFFPSQDWSRLGSLDDLGANHPESSGKVYGRVRLGERMIEVRNGLGHRDHSWGKRRHMVIRNNRWLAGTVGPALSFSLSSVQLENGDFFRGSWVMRNGHREAVADYSTVVHLLEDGISVIGGATRVRLDSGETLDIEMETIDCIVTSSHYPNGGPGSTPAGVEALSIVRWNGHEGVCDLNVNINPLRGEQAVSHLLWANTETGLSQRPPHDLEWARERLFKPAKR